MKRKIKMIAYDLDGTLLTTDKKLTDRTRNALQKAKQQGIMIVPTTGRPVTGIPKDVKDMEGVEYLITANGGRVVHQDNTIYKKLLPVEASKRVLEIFSEYDTLTEIYYNGYGYSEKAKLDNIYHYMPTKAMADYIVTTRCPVENLWKKFEEEKQPMDKMQAIFANENERMEAWSRLGDMEGVTFADSLGVNIEVNASGTSKADALEWLVGQLGIDMDEVMSFGDATNDLLMIERTGIGVAMKNAAEEVKEQANFVTDSNDEDGVAKFIEKYLEENRKC